MPAPAIDYFLCPHCGEALSFQPHPLYWIRHFWTDGTNLNWKLDDFDDRLRRGYKCGRYFWRSDAATLGGEELKEVEERSARRFADEQKQSPDFRALYHQRYEPYGLCEPETGELKVALNDLPLNRIQERWLRLRLWRSFNEPIRRALDSYSRGPYFVSGSLKLPPEYLENVKRLIELLDSDVPRHRLLIAELHRETSQFSEAVSVLDGYDHMLYAAREDELKSYDSRVADFRADPSLKNVSFPIWAENLMEVAESIRRFSAEGDHLVRPLSSPWGEED